MVKMVRYKGCYMSEVTGEMQVTNLHFGQKRNPWQNSRNPPPHSQMTLVTKTYAGFHIRLPVTEIQILLDSTSMKQVWQSVLLAWEPEKSPPSVWSWYKTQMPNPSLDVQITYSFPTATGKNQDCPSSEALAGLAHRNQYDILDLGAILPSEFTCYWKDEATLNTIFLKLKFPDYIKQETEGLLTPSLLHPLLLTSSKQLKQTIAPTTLFTGIHTYILQRNKNKTSTVLKWRRKLSIWINASCNIY